jgi:hypothetical protein
MNNLGSEYLFLRSNYEEFKDIRFSHLTQAGKFSKTPPVSPEESAQMNLVGLG